MKKIILFILVAAVSISLSAYTFDASVQKDLCELQKQAFMLEYGTQVNDLINQFEQRSNIEQLPEQEALTVKANVLIVKMNNVTDKKELKHLIKKSKTTFLSANIEFSDTEMKKLVKPYIIKNVGGQRVLIIGVTTPALSNLSCSDGVTIYDPISIVRKIISENY